MVTIRRTIVVEYESELTLAEEQAAQVMVYLDGVVPPFAELTERVEALNEDSKSGPDGCSRRVG